NVVRLEHSFSTRSDVVLLTLERPASAPFDDRAKAMLEALGGECVLRIEQRRVNGLGLVDTPALEGERHRAEDLRLINELGRLVAQHIELHAVLSTAAGELARLLEVARVHVMLVDEMKVHLRGVAYAGEAVADIDLPLTSSHAVAEAFRTL